MHLVSFYIFVNLFGEYSPLCGSRQKSPNPKKNCLSYDLQMHSVTPFRSLKVRIDDLISRKMDIWYADHNYLLIYTNSIPMDYNYETWQARLWRHTILVDPSPISLEIGELSDFKPRNLPKYLCCQTFFNWVEFWLWCDVCPINLCRLH